MAKALEDAPTSVEQEEPSRVLRSIEELRLQQQHNNDISGLTPTVRYGSLWSQYHTLDAATILLLEKAVLYRHVRAFKESLAICHAFPVQIRYHPIVAFETSLTFWALWRLWDGADVLRDALDWADCNNSLESNGPGIYTLLRATLGLTEIYNKGDFTQARDSLVEIRTWLLTTPIDEYNDLQVCLKYIKLHTAARFD